MQQPSKHNIWLQRILQVVKLFLIIFLLFAVVLAGFTVYSWVQVIQHQSESTTTFISSSSNDVVRRLGCWNKDEVESVTINVTSIIVYSSDRPSNEALEGNKLDKTETRKPLEGPYKFQLFYRGYNKPLFTVLEGHIVYSFTVQSFISRNKSLCALEIFEFDSYFEFMKYLNTDDEKFRYSNRTCLTTNKTEDVFLVSFTLPAQQYTYIAGKPSSGVKEVTYSAIGGSITTYDTSQLNQEECDYINNGEDCSISIGGKFGVFNTKERCIYVTQVLNNNYDYEYVKADILKAHLPAIIFTSIVTAFLLAIVILLLCIVCIVKCNYKQHKISGSGTQPVVLHNPAELSAEAADNHDQNPEAKDGKSDDVQDANQINDDDDEVHSTTNQQQAQGDDVLQKSKGQQVSGLEDPNGSDGKLSNNADNEVNSTDQTDFIQQAQGYSVDTVLQNPNTKDQQVSGLEQSHKIINNTSSLLKSAESTTGDPASKAIYAGLSKPVSIIAPEVKAKVCE